MSEIPNFPTVHCHPLSLDSGSTPESFAEREVELGTGTITCTDHGSLAAARRIYDLGHENGLIPVLGAEFYLRDDACSILSANGYQKNERGAFIGAPKYLHLTTHFLDQEAYETGVRLLSDADLRLEATLEMLEPSDRKHGQERKPLFTWRDVEELGSKNVIFTSSCMIGIFKRHLFDNNDMKSAVAYFEKIKALAKPGNFYVEVNPHDVSRNWTQGIFFTMSDGEKIQHYSGKKLMTN